VRVVGCRSAAGRLALQTGVRWNTAAQPTGQRRSNHAPTPPCALFFSCDRVLALDPEAGDARRAKLVALIELGRYEDAEALAASSGAEYERSYCLYQLNRESEALALLPAEGAGEAGEALSVLKAQIYYRLGDFAKSASLFKVTIRMGFLCVFRLAGCFHCRTAAARLSSRSRGSVLHIYIYICLYLSIYLYIYIYIYIYIRRPTRPASHTARPPWPLQDIRSLQSFVALVSHPCVAPSICIAHTTGILLHE